MKLLATLPLLVLCALSMAHDPNPNLVGKWKLKLDAEVRDLSKKLGVPEPAAEFVFLPDQTFRYVTGQGTSQVAKAGRYSVDGDRVTLNSPDWPGQATLMQDSLAFNGFSFVKEFEFNPIGEWFLSRNGATDTEIKAVFKKDGTFEFHCSNAFSKGTFRLIGREILLEWTEVDGDRIAAGSMRKKLLVDENGEGFCVDQWHYIRRT